MLGTASASSIRTDNGSRSSFRWASSRRTAPDRLASASSRISGNAASTWCRPFRRVMPRSSSNPRIWLMSRDALSRSLSARPSASLRRSWKPSTVSKVNYSLTVATWVQLHFPVPWHFRATLLQLPGSASWLSGPMHVCVYMHQNKPSLQGGTVSSRSASMKSPFQRSAEHS